MKIDFIKKLENKTEFKLSNSFYESVKISAFAKKIKGKTPKSWVKIFYKTYPRLNRVLLPPPTKTKANLFDLIVSRRSRRKFAKKDISIKDLSTLLFYSAGITKIENNNWDIAIRNYPSAGARFPLEIYVVANYMEKIKKGIYHYNVKEHSLETLRSGNYNQLMYQLTDQKISMEAGIIIIISAVFDRTRIKYKDRGYRFPFIEAGHLAQNTYLISEALNLNCCTIGGFIDDKINELLDLADSCEKVIYIITVGSKL